MQCKESKRALRLDEALALLSIGLIATHAASSEVEHTRQPTSALWLAIIATDVPEATQEALQSTREHTLTHQSQ
jgi:hypothetical protein